MSFKTKKYQVIRQALPIELANFIFNYMLLQRDAVDYLMKHGKVHQPNFFIGRRDDPQVSGCYAKYADWVMETLLMYMIPIMKEKTGLELIPTYTYTRLYEKGNVLKRHKDRPSCEVSTTLHLGGNEWDIYLEPNNKIRLKQGDMLIYAGQELEHWREPFEGEVCSQVFLHYNHANGPYAKTNFLDGRPLLGLPSSHIRR
jgi:hypothetical protein